MTGRRDASMTRGTGSAAAAFRVWLLLCWWAAAGDAAVVVDAEGVCEKEGGRTTREYRLACEHVCVSEARVRVTKNMRVI